jgi:formate/nitrite transporter FocA (FNT family)
MFGAIMGHITKLGISISADVHPDLEGPSMFIMATVAFLASLIIIILRRAQLPIVGAKFANASAASE